MRVSGFLVAVLSLTGAAVAQIPGLPPCAQTCVSIPPECQTTDFTCICSDRNFITSISCCIAKSCNAADQAIVVKFSQALCGGYGVDVPKSASCPSTVGGSFSPQTSVAPVQAAGAASGSSGGNGTVMPVTVTTTATTTKTTTVNTAGGVVWLPDLLQAGGIAGAVAGVMAVL